MSGGGWGWGEASIDAYVKIVCECPFIRTPNLLEENNGNKKQICHDKKYSEN